MDAGAAMRLALDIEELLTIKNRIVEGNLAELLFHRPRVVRQNAS